MDMDLSKLWRRDRYEIVRTGSDCERVEGRRIIGPWHEELEGAGAMLVLERSGRIEGWCAWQIGTLSLGEKVTHPHEAELPRFTPSPAGDSLLLTDLVICDGLNLDRAKRLFRAVCPRLAIERGLPRVAMCLELSDEARGSFSVSGFLMQKIWGTNEAPTDGFDLARESQCQPVRFQAKESGGHVVLAQWSNPIP